VVDVTPEQTPDHAAEAAQALDASTYQRQRWGECEIVDGYLKAAMWEMERAKVNALLSIDGHLAVIAAALDGHEDDGKLPRPLDQIAAALASHRGPK